MEREAVFARIDALRRPASSAVVGGFRPPSGLASWFGGNFYCDEGSCTWPQLDGNDATPLLQIVSAELPVCPGQVGRFAVLQVFLSQHQLPTGGPVGNGNGFLIREFINSEDLVPCEPSGPISMLRPFPVRWERAPHEGPVWAEAHRHVGRETFDRFAARQKNAEEYIQRYHGHTGTKVGGWPTYIHSAPIATGDFVIQIASERKPGWKLADNGNLYLYASSNGQWSMWWDSY